MAETKRPVLKIPMSDLEKVLESVALVGLIGIIVMLCISWTGAPERIPHHFGFDGKPDDWGGKGILLFVPIVTVFLYLLLTIVGKFPHLYNYMVEITEENAGFQYRNARIMMSWLKTDIVFIFGYIEMTMVLTALGKAKGLGMGFLPVFLVILFGTVGYYTYRMVKNK